MTNKKSILTYVLAICLIIPAMLMFTACGKPISEKGKTYSVANKKTDITIHWGDDKATQLEEIGSEENAINAFASFSISFDNDGKAVISAMGRSDESKFYAINENNVLAFYNTAEDAANGIGKCDDGFYNAEYTFSPDKKVITVKTSISDEDVEHKSSVVIKLTVNV